MNAVTLLKFILFLSFYLELQFFQAKYAHFKQLDKFSPQIYFVQN